MSTTSLPSSPANQIRSLDLKPKVCRLAKLPPEMIALISRYLDFPSLLAFASSHPSFAWLWPDFYDFTVSKKMLKAKDATDVVLMNNFLADFPVEEVRLEVTWRDVGIRLKPLSARMRYKVWDEEDLVEVTGHMCHQLTVPWNSKGFCHSEAVFKLKFISMSRIDVRLVGERRAFQEGVVTIVSSTEPTRRKRSAIPRFAKLLGPAFFLG